MELVSPASRADRKRRPDRVQDVSHGRLMVSLTAIAKPEHLIPPHPLAANAKTRPGVGNRATWALTAELHFDLGS